MWIVEHWEQAVAVAAIAVAWGTLQATLRSVQRDVRDGFERVNGRLNNHGERIGELEKSDAQLRGTLGVPLR